MPQSCELGPSSRYRVYQLVPLLEQMGFACEVSPGIGKELYEQLYLRGGGSKLAALRAVWQQRRQDLRRVNDFDAVFIQKGFFPGLHAGIEVAMAKRKPVIFDFDDAIWLPRQGGASLARALHRETEVQQILRIATAVIAGNEFLAEYARRFNPNVTVVPSAVDTSRYPRAAGSTTVGWIGSRTTLPYLAPLRPAFEALRVKPRVIASGDPGVLGFPVEFRQWSLETETAELAQLGIGIAPLPDNAWECGKCGVKILQYMACSLPVVASPVGANAEIVRDGVTGFLARDATEWIEKLRQLTNDAGLRETMGRAGRELVEQRYSVQAAAEQVATVLRQVL